MLDVAKAKALLGEANQLYEQFIALNSYPFKENSLEYFYIDKSGAFNTDPESIKTYHQQLLTALEKLIAELEKVKDDENIGARIASRFQNDYENILNGSFWKDVDDIRIYLKRTVYKLVNSYCDYISFLQNYIEKKNVDAAQIAILLNDFFKSIHVYSISCSEGDKWEDLIFDPEIHVSDNLTTDKNKVDCICQMYLCAYAIDIDNKKSFVLHKGRVSIWKLKGE